MSEVFIYDAVRTPRGRGKPDGALHEVTSLSLVSQVLRAIADRNALPENSVEDVILGCVDPIGEAGGDIARIAALHAGLGLTVPGVQINRFCASGLEAVNLAAGQIAASQKDLVIAGGVESMSRIGMMASGGAWAFDPSSAIPTFFMPQGIAADLVASKYGFSRTDVDGYAVRSQQRSARSWQEGRFAGSIIPVRDINGIVLLDHDEHMRPETTLQSLAALRPSFVEIGQMGGFDAVAIQAHPEVEKIDHIHHAGNSSGIVDGAAAVLVGSAEAGRRFGLRPRARLKAAASIGSDTALMLTGPVDVTQRLLAKTGMATRDIDIFEINEAFASMVLRYIQAFDLDPEEVNPCGGAIAMGHPLGATGAMILGTALDELERTGAATALITLCVAAGMGTATMIERV